MTIDPVTLNIVGKSLIAIAHEMAANMRRASYSTVVREARDFSVGLLDANGDVVAQAEMIPMQTGGISQAFRAIAEDVDLSNLTPDDALITNDSFRGGQHLQDIFLYSPIFDGERLIGFGASVAHHLDIGGGMPGLNATATEIYQEGIRIPATRFSVSRDWNGGFVENFIRANIRVPRKGIGDLNAQFAANNTAIERMADVPGWLKFPYTLLVCLLAPVFALVGLPDAYDILVANQNGLQGGNGGIVRVTPAGDKAVVSQGGIFRDPVDVVIP
jgi:N-methylhydantoinase B